MPRFLDAREAAALLDVSPATLYSYVSRGLLRSEAAAGTRRRRYHAEDVALLRRRKEARRDPLRAAGTALRFDGFPVLESKLTLIDGERYHYRGRDAIAWATGHSLEETAALLWEAPFPDEFPEAADRQWREIERATARLPLAESLQVALAMAAGADDEAFDLEAAAVRRAGARILRTMAAVAAGARPQAAPVGRTLRQGWGVRRRDVARLLDTALGICADHELNVSAFTARCVASAGSTPYATVGAALAALQGTRHGGHTERVAALLDERTPARSARAVMATRRRRGEAVSGFGHPLYPDGDPRAGALLGLARAHRPGSRAVAVADEFLAHAAEAPNLDFGLVTLSRALGLPADAPFALFALGRTVGWIAHALEQYGTGLLIRPRARYTGEPVATDATRSPAPRDRRG